VVTQGLKKKLNKRSGTGTINETKRDRRPTLRHLHGGEKAGDVKRVGSNWCSGVGGTKSWGHGVVAPYGEKTTKIKGTIKNRAKNSKCGVETSDKKSRKSDNDRGLRVNERAQRTWEDCNQNG